MHRAKYAKNVLSWPKQSSLCVLKQPSGYDNQMTCVIVDPLNAQDP